jgi:hypothetical protein
MGMEGEARPCHCGTPCRLVGTGGCRQPEMGPGRSCASDGRCPHSAVTAAFHSNAAVAAIKARTDLVLVYAGVQESACVSNCKVTAPAIDSDEEPSGSAAARAETEVGSCEDQGPWCQWCGREMQDDTRLRVRKGRL